MQPALCIESLLCFVGHVEVTHEDVAAPEADLTVSLLVRVVQLRLAPWDLYTTTAGQNSIFLSHHQPRFELSLICQCKEIQCQKQVEVKREMYLVSLKASGRETV